MIKTLQITIKFTCYNFCSSSELLLQCNTIQIALISKASFFGKNDIFDMHIENS